MPRFPATPLFPAPLQPQPRRPALLAAPSRSPSPSLLPSLPLAALRPSSSSGTSPPPPRGRARPGRRSRSLRPRPGGTCQGPDRPPPCPRSQPWARSSSLPPGGSPWPAPQRRHRRPVPRPVCRPRAAHRHRARPAAWSRRLRRPGSAAPVGPAEQPRGRLQGVPGRRRGAAGAEPRGAPDEPRARPALPAHLRHIGTMGPSGGAAPSARMAP
ncbi:uncharacterized protein LOC141727948 [Zonotrichia albicollis]|uniref:uncharacterized protein LOC141727948 n=1 Tax=Zonotrichia albicollis TaxID=44394 RepID=UPI003D80F480